MIMHRRDGKFKACKKLLVCMQTMGVHGIVRPVIYTRISPKDRVNYVAASLLCALQKFSRGGPLLSIEWIVDWLPGLS